MHYSRWRTTGRTDLIDPETRFWSHVDRRGPGDCWEWQAAKDRHGYGVARFMGRGKPSRAHRVAYEYVNGTIPGDLPLDHLCRNPLCVNPAHLEPVTMAENFRRGIDPNEKKRNMTACKHGHPFSEANTYWRSDGARRCRECGNAAVRRYRERKRTG